MSEGTAEQAKGTNDTAARSSATRDSSAPPANEPQRPGLTPLVWSGGLVAGVLAMLFWQMK